MKRSDVRSRAAWARIAASAEKWARCRMLAMLTRATSFCCLQVQHTHIHTQCEKVITCEQSHTINSILLHWPSEQIDSTLGRNAEHAPRSPLPSEVRSSYASKMRPYCTAPKTMSSGHTIIKTFLNFFEGLTASCFFPHSLLYFTMGLCHTPNWADLLIL